MLDQIENWNSPTRSGSTAPGDSPNGPWSQPNFPVSGFDAGWQSHMVQTMASFGDSKGGPQQDNLIQTNDQALQGILAVTTPHQG